jgi:hypothetical protein
MVVGVGDIHNAIPELAGLPPTSEVEVVAAIPAVEAVIVAAILVTVTLAEVAIVVVTAATKWVELPLTSVEDARSGPLPKRDSTKLSLKFVTTGALACKRRRTSLYLNLNLPF